MAMGGGSTTLTPGEHQDVSSTNDFTKVNMPERAPEVREATPAQKQAGLELKDVMKSMDSAYNKAFNDWMKAGGTTAEIIVGNALGEAKSVNEFLGALCENWRVYSGTKQPMKDKKWNELIESKDLDKVINAYELVWGTYFGVRNVQSKVEELTNLPDGIKLTDSEIKDIRNFDKIKNRDGRRIVSNRYLEAFAYKEEKSTLAPPPVPTLAPSPTARVAPSTTEGQAKQDILLPPPIPLNKGKAEWDEAGEGGTETDRAEWDETEPTGSKAKAEFVSTSIQYDDLIEKVRDFNVSLEKRKGIAYGSAYGEGKVENGGWAIDQNKKKLANQDRAGAYSLSNGGQLLFVADGVSQSRYSNIAATIAQVIVENRLEDFGKVNDVESCKSLVATTIKEIRTNLDKYKSKLKATYNFDDADDELHGFDSTLSIAVVIPNTNKMVIAHLGDSRILLIDPLTTDPKLESKQVTVDHDLAAQGQGNVITTSLMNGVPDVTVEDVKKGDCVVAYSDGFEESKTGIKDSQPQEIISTVLNYLNRPMDACLALMKLGRTMGPGKDNLSAAVIKVV